MTYTDFAEKLLIALYQETERELSGPFETTFETLIDRYGLPKNERWIERVATEWRAEGLADVSDELGPAANLSIEITGKGMRRVEAAYGSKDGVGEILRPIDVLPSNAITTESGEPLVTEAGDYIVAEGPVSDVPIDIPLSVSSEAWTGVETRLKRDELAVNRIRQHVAQLDREVENLGLTNQERAKVKAITEALVKLIESPEPEWKAIVELLRSPTLGAILGLAGLTQLVLKLVFGIG